MDSNNYSLITAGPATHVKVVIVALIAGIAIVGSALAARPELPDMSTRIEARAPVLKADRPVVWTSSEHISVR